MTLSTHTPSATITVVDKTKTTEASRKVTPEAPRSLIQVDLPSCNDKGAASETSNDGRFPFLNLSKPFSTEMESMYLQPLMPRADAARRAADLLRDLPVRKISLRRRVSGTAAAAAALSAVTTQQHCDTEHLSLCHLPLAMASDHKAPILTPARPTKRQRLSPPALLRPLDSRAPLVVTAADAVPTGLFLPTI